MTPEVVVNGRCLSRRVTGVERHGREILPWLGDRCRLELTRSQGVRGHLWEQFILPRRLNQKSVLWSPANTGPLLVRRQALTVHDLSPLEHPEWFDDRFAAWYRLFLPILIKSVRVVLTPSAYVKEKIVRRFGLQNVTVTPNGVDPAVFQPHAKQHQYEIPPSYVLFVGTVEPRKNLDGLLKAWNRVKAGLAESWLVIAGMRGSVHRAVDLARDTERVLFLGYVEATALPGLYAAASLLVLPSFDEGFGLPVLEAMSCGTPVLVSNRGALPEVAGDAGYVYDSSKPDALATAVTLCLSDSALRACLRERGLKRAAEFSWKKSAERVWNVLNEI